MAADSLSRILRSAAKVTRETVTDDYSYLNFVTDDVPCLDSYEISVETDRDPKL